MKENRERNEVVWRMYQDNMTYEQMAKVCKISRQRAWAIVQNGIHRRLVEILKKPLSTPPTTATIDKIREGE